MFNLVSVPVVAAIGSLATLLMVVAMLYMVWLALDDETHRPTPDTGNEPETTDK